MANPSDNFSRRSFLQSALAGTMFSLAKSASAIETDVNPQERNHKSAGENDDLARLSLREASDLVHKKKVSPVELTKACLARIDRFNPTLNAFITVTNDSAMEQARTAESEVMHGNWRGPLHGVPVALKDLFDTAGVRTTAGSGVFKDRIPAEDAEVVRRLKATGAVLLGKTNMHEFAYGGSSTVSYFGAVRNPWDQAYSTGGSSGGSAAAVAAGLCFGALGSDTGGSIRQPAAYCGIVGHKPTYGLVSTRGAVPLSWSLDHAGPIARSVSDAAIVLQAIAGYDDEEITSKQVATTNYITALRERTSSLRVGIAHQFFFDGLDADIESATKEALLVLGTLTATVKEVSTLPLENITDRTVLAAEAYAYHAPFAEKKPQQYQPPTLAAIRTGAAIRASDYILARRELAHLRRVIRQVFDSVDVLITPTSPINTPTISAFDDAFNDPSYPGPATDIRRLTLRNTSPFDKYGLPTISVPCGFTRTGLPIGLQIAGAPGRDAVVLQLAYAYEQATEWHKQMPKMA
jgi:aspartyl-tRNA(Asn)/glutamyl-tRNA(Gln) amidotransferase subunit A